MAIVTVNKQDRARFKVPLKWLVRTSKLFANLFRCANIERSPRCLEQVSSQDFSDFCRWIHGKRIAVPWCTETPYVVATTARRLVKAVALGIRLDCAEYQLVAMEEFLSFAPGLEWPEDHVNEIWAVTKC
jgi:hypothetical protein